MSILEEYALMAMEMDIICNINDKNSFFRVESIRGNKTGQITELIEFYYTGRITEKINDDITVFIEEINLSNVNELAFEDILFEYEYDLDNGEIENIEDIDNYNKAVMSLYNIVKTKYSKFMNKLTKIYIKYIHSLDYKYESNFIALIEAAIGTDTVFIFDENGNYVKWDDVY